MSPRPVRAASASAASSASAGIAAQPASTALAASSSVEERTSRSAASEVATSGTPHQGSPEGREVEMGSPRARSMGASAAASSCDRTST
eukprot:CAMPEP_0185530992 /NCGR_PEP_ID=MMETSP1366-20130426/105500_1 /TAXON_ID=38817 /ORGANISM="Gephyrocapsa oceanica, Strain RCC1303" /LENGTH=88 /DNA_ID=CAMNT_0028142687 /DNA_START=34 /DNA_END=296 /DNA_ORIENTATION=-